MRLVHKLKNKITKTKSEIVLLDNIFKEQGFNRGTNLLAGKNWH